MEMIKRGKRVLKSQHLSDIYPPIELYFICDECEAEYRGMSDDTDIIENMGQDNYALGVHYICPNCNTPINIFIDRVTKEVK